GSESRSASPCRCRARRPGWRRAARSAGRGTWWRTALRSCLLLGDDAQRAHGSRLALVVLDGLDLVRCAPAQIALALRIESEVRHAPVAVGERHLAPGMRQLA